MYKFNCIVCGKESIRKSFLPTMKFCSRKCRWKDKDYRNKMIESSKKLNLNPTEKMLEARFRKGHTINNGKHRSIETEFKSGELNPHWKGGTEHYRGEDWEEQRKKALERDNSTCQRCGDATDTVHHIIPYSESENNSLDNLISLCKRCHIIVERGYSRIIIDGEDIVITQVPDTSLNRFEEISNQEFNGNMAMTLKFLLDFRDGILMTPNQALIDEVNQMEQELSARIDLLADDVNKLKEQSIKKGRRMNDGRVIGK